MHASLPPSSICSGTMLAFLQMEMPVSPPVKLMQSTPAPTTARRHSHQPGQGRAAAGQSAVIKTPSKAKPVEHRGIPLPEGSKRLPE
jgi:hypothetical protein